MRKLSRGALAAIAVAVLVPAGFAVAKSAEHSRWHQMSPETRARLDEGKLAMAKTALKLNAEQEKLWAAVETEGQRPDAQPPVGVDLARAHFVKTDGVALAEAG